MITGGMFNPIRNGIRFPGIGAIVRVPDPFMNSARGRKLHRDVMKTSVSETLDWHNRRIMPGHFRQTNRATYEHKPRKPGWKSFKRKIYGSITDIKATGKSQIKFKQNPRTSFVQKSGDGVVHGYKRYKWPFPKRESRSNKHVDIYDLNDEVTRWTPSETQQAVRKCRDSFVRKYEAEIATKKKFKKVIGPKLGEL